MTDSIFLDSYELGHFGDPSLELSFYIDPRSGRVTTVHEHEVIATLCLHNVVYLGRYCQQKKPMAKIAIGNSAIYFNSMMASIASFSIDRNEVRSRWFNSKIIDFFILAVVKIFSAPSREEQLAKLCLAKQDSAEQKN